MWSQDRGSRRRQPAVDAAAEGSEVIAGGAHLSAGEAEGGAAERPGPLVGDVPERVAMLPQHMPDPGTVAKRSLWPTRHAITREVRMANQQARIIEEPRSLPHRPKQIVGLLPGTPPCARAGSNLLIEVADLFND